MPAAAVDFDTHTQNADLPAQYPEKWIMMNADSPNPYAVNAMPNAAVFAEDSARLEFIRRTYAHLTGAILALIALEVVLFAVVPAATMRGLVTTMTGGWGWLIVLGAFMAVSWIARSSELSTA